MEQRTKVGKRLALLLFFILLPGLSAGAEKSPWDRKLPFENATIKYAISGNEQGSETLYIEDYGRKTATYHTTVTKVMGFGAEHKTVKIEDPDWVYSYDLKKRSGTKSTNPKKYMREEYQKLSAADKEQVQKNAKQLGMGVMNSMGGSTVENAEEIMGYKCDRTTVMGSTIYLIHHTPIALKSQTDVMGMKINKEATSFIKGAVPEKYFKAPEGIEAVYDQQADQMARQIAQRTIAWLKDPDAASKMPRIDAPQMRGAGGEVPQQDEEMMKKAKELMKGFKGALGN